MPRTQVSTEVSACHWEGNTYQRFRYAFDSDGFRTVIGVVGSAATESRFESNAFKRRLMESVRNLPTGDGDYTRYLVNSDSARIMLLGEFRFTGLPEVTFFKYSIVDWRWDEWVEGFDNYEILVGYNSPLDHLYVLTHPLPLFRSNARVFGSNREYPLAMMKGNLNAMLTDSQRLRDVAPLCLAGLVAVLELQEPGYPCVIISCTSDLLYAMKISKWLSEQPGTFDPHSVDDILRFAPGIDPMDTAYLSLPDLAPEYEHGIIALIDAFGVRVSPVVEKYGRGGTWRVELSVVSTADNNLYRVEVWTNMAGMVDTWRIVARPTILPVSF